MGIDEHKFTEGVFVIRDFNEQPGHAPISFLSLFFALFTDAVQ